MLHGHEQKSLAKLLRMEVEKHCLQRQIFRCEVIDESGLCSVQCPAAPGTSQDSGIPGSHICLLWPLFRSLHLTGTCSLCFRAWAQSRQLFNWFMSFTRNFFSLKLMTWSQIVKRDSLPPISVLLFPILQCKWDDVGAPLAVSLAWVSISTELGTFLDGRPLPSTSTFKSWEGHWWHRACRSRPLSSFLRT